MIRANKFLYVFLGVLFCSSIYIRFHGLNVDSVWLDEAGSWKQSMRDFQEMLQFLAQDNYPPLHNIFLYFAIRIFGDGEFYLRAPSAIFGILNIPAIYFAGKIFGNKFVGMVAAVLLTFSGFHIWYSQEARSYSLLALTSTIYLITVLQSLKTGSLKWNIWAFVASLALLYSHPYGFLLYSSIVCLIVIKSLFPSLINRVAYVKCIAWQILGFILFAPWFFILLNRTATIVSTSGFWIPRPSFTYVAFLFENLASGFFMGWLLLLTGTLAIFSKYVRSKNLSSINQYYLEQPESSFIFLLAWLFVPFILALAASLLTTPILYDRYLICSLPALLILAAIGIDKISFGFHKTTVFVVTLISVLSYWYYTPIKRADYRSAVSLYQSMAKPEDCVVSVMYYLRTPIEYYLRKEPDCLILKLGLYEVKPWELNSNQVWIFSGEFLPKEQEEEMIKVTKEHGWEIEEYPNWGIHLFRAYKAFP